MRQSLEIVVTTNFDPMQDLETIKLHLAAEIKGVCAIFLNTPTLETTVEIKPGEPA